MKFSLVIPAYKATFLKEAIESCLSQTYQNYELIIVDDCSPEDLKAIVDKFSDTRIHYFRNEKNCGAVDVVDNWNICLSYCTGDYVICMGDDDMLSEDALVEYAYYIRKHPAVEVLHGRTMLINEYSSSIKILEKRDEFESIDVFLEKRLSGTLQFIGDFCFKIEPLRRNGGFYKLPLAWGSDDITALRAAENNGIVHTQKTIFKYRVNQSTITSTGNIKIKLQASLMHKRWCKCLLERLNYKLPTERYSLLDKKIDVFFYKVMADGIIRHFINTPNNYRDCLAFFKQYQIPKKTIINESVLLSLNYIKSKIKSLLS